MNALYCYQDDNDDDDDDDDNERSLENYLTDMFQSLTLRLPLSCSFLTRFLSPTEERLPVGYVTYVWEHVI